MEKEPTESEVIVAEPKITEGEIKYKIIENADGSWAKEYVNLVRNKM